MAIKAIFKAAAVAAVLASSAGVQAEGLNPYSDCGIGAALFPDTHWAAVTSNVIWDLGTTAVTSATASPETCKGASVAAAMFINSSYDALAEETARGEGDHLTAMLDIVGCSSAEQPEAAARIRSEMAEAVTAEQYAGQSRLEKSSAYYDMMQRSVSASCSAAGV